MMSSLLRSAASCLKLKPFEPVPRLGRAGLVVAVVWASSGCVRQPPQFSTLSRPVEQNGSAPSALASSNSPALVARSLHLRVETARRLLLALSMRDSVTLARLVTQDCQLIRDQRSVQATAQAILAEIEMAMPRLHASGDEPGAVTLFASDLAPDSPEGGTLLLDVVGPRGVDGRWTLLFSASPVDKITEIRLPPRAG